MPFLKEVYAYMSMCLNALLNSMKQQNFIWESPHCDFYLCIAVPWMI